MRSPNQVARSLKWKRATTGGGQDIELKYEGATKNAGPYAVTNMSGVGDFGYNSRGEQISSPDRTVAYTSFGLPSSITTASGAKTTFQYDAENTRVLRQGADGSSTIYAGGLYERRKITSGTTHVFYIIGPGEMVGQLESSGAGTENIQYYDLDRLGSTSETIDAFGTVTSMRRDPWGQLLSVASDTVRIGFTGQEDDVEFGLINMGGRIYDPKTTRFLTPDPIGGSLGSAAVNRYAYVLNNPTNLVDPTGFEESETSGEMLGWETAQPVEGFYRGVDYSLGSPVRYSCTEPGGEGECKASRIPSVDLVVRLKTTTPAPAPPAPQPSSPPVADQTGSVSGLAQLSGTANAGYSPHINMGPRTLDPTPLYAGANPQGSIGKVIEEVGSLVVPTSPEELAIATILPVVGKYLGEVRVLGKMLQKATRGSLVATLGARVRQLAGFGEKGVPLILDENVMARGLAEGLRANGYNVRSVVEIFGRTGVADQDIINVANSVGGRVITNNVRDFGRALAIPLPRTGGWTPEGVAQFIEYFLK